MTIEELKSMLEQSKTELPSIIEKQVSEILAKKATETEPKPEPVEVEQKQGGALEGISKMKVWDIPLGEGLLGGSVAVVFSELVDGFLKNQAERTKGFLKLVAAGAIAKWASRFLGPTGAKAAAIILVYDGMRQILPIDEWAGNLAERITKVRTGGGLAGKAGMTQSAAVTQAEKVAKDYYAGLYGGA
jgi:hypothetical protein